MASDESTNKGLFDLMDKATEQIEKKKFIHNYLKTNIILIKTNSIRSVLVKTYNLKRICKEESNRTTTWLV